MKKVFYLLVVCWLIFEICTVYFIMPMPGSQRMNSISLAYFIYSFRWIFRLILWACIAYCFVKGKWVKTIWPVLVLALISTISFAINFKASADKMFLKVSKLNYATSLINKIDTNAIIIGVSFNGRAAAYPIRFLSYHHQLSDTLDGKNFMVTYCNVCHTGRVFNPEINGKMENFRLVGMDHFNAMFEDETTGTWWRQATGEAIAGKLKGKKLEELYSSQMRLGDWLMLHPNSKIMQADSTFLNQYDMQGKYEAGLSKSDLTKTETEIGKDKSLVLGIVLDGKQRAYYWNELLKNGRIIQDKIGDQSVIIIAAENSKSFFAYKIKNGISSELKNNAIQLDETYSMFGVNIKNPSSKLEPIQCYQDFKHSWVTFYPSTTFYTFKTN